MRRRILVAGTYDPALPRNRRLIALLDRCGYDVAVCRIDVWGGDRHEIPAQRKLRTLCRALVAYPRLIWRFLRAPRADLVLVLYPGWFDMVVLGPLARMRRTPVVFDVFISLYDTVVSDRGLASPGSLVGRLCKAVDRASLRRADRVLADTPQHADFFAQLAAVPRGRIGVVWLGAQDDLFVPQSQIEPAANRVLFYGTFVALQGVPTIIRAAKLLDGEQVSFRIIGSGQDSAAVGRLLDELRPGNVEVIDWLPAERLAPEIAEATICLGIFGTSDKAHRVIPNKLYECVAVGRPVVSGDTEAVRAAFTPEEIALVPPGDPESLAATIRRLLADPAGREALARRAHEHYVREYAEEPASHVLASELQQI